MPFKNVLINLLILQKKTVLINKKYNLLVSKSIKKV